MSSPLTNRLTISPFVPNNEPTVDLATLFNAASASSLVFNLDDPLSKQLIYDIIVSFTYAIPIQTITLSP